jgi:hypothetical protein
LSCEYLREFSKKFETALLVNSGAWGKLIHEKKQKSKISWHCPFKAEDVAEVRHEQNKAIGPEELNGNVRILLPIQEEVLL